MLCPTCGSEVIVGGEITHYYKAVIDPGKYWGMKETLKEALVFIKEYRNEDAIKGTCDCFACKLAKKIQKILDDIKEAT